MSIESDEEHQERQYIHTTNDNDIYGDDIKQKSHNNKILRLCFININGLPNNSEHPKNTALFQAIQSTQIDIIALTEINKCWHKMEEKERWRTRTKGWWETSHSTITYNTKDSDAKQFQPGGNIITSIDKAAHRVI